MRRALLMAPLLLLLPVSAALAASAIYKWTDSDGNIHYEDRPPNDVDVEVLRRPEIYRGPATPDPAAAAAAARREKCDTARVRLNEVLKAPRLYRLDSRGNRSYLTAEEHREHTEELRTEVRALCEEPER